MKLKAIHKTLDKWFSLYIRRRDTPGPCVSCGVMLTFEDSDCGHFISRDRISTRWNEKNAHAQCRNCNRFRSGEQYRHGLEIGKRHGPTVADELLWRSRHAMKLTDAEVKAKAAFFREQYKTLTNLKG